LPAPGRAAAALQTVDDLIGLIAAKLGDALDPVLSRLMLEATRESERDRVLRERMGALLGAYRRLMVETVRADQARGAVFDGAPPEAIASVGGERTGGEHRPGPTRGSGAEPRPRRPRKRDEPRSCRARREHRPVVGRRRAAPEPAPLGGEHDERPERQAERARHDVRDQDGVAHAWST
jgi:hypothetical protein